MCVCLCLLYATPSHHKPRRRHCDEKPATNCLVSFEPCAVGMCGDVGAYAPRHWCKYYLTWALAWWGKVFFRFFCMVGQGVGVGTSFFPATFGGRCMGWQGGQGRLLWVVGGVGLVGLCCMRVTCESM